MGKNNIQRRRQKKNNQISKSKENKKIKMKRANKSLNPVFLVHPNPFANMDANTRKQIMQEIAQSSEKKYQESLTRIKEILIKYDPTLLLSIISSYCLTVGVGNNGIQARSRDETFLQAHLELCQGFVLQLKPEKMQWSIVDPVAVQDLIDYLKNLMTYHQHRELAQNTVEAGEDDKAIKNLQSWVRGHTQIVRNWGYFSQVKSLSQEMYCYFDDMIKNKFGFTVTNVIDLFQFIIQKTEVGNTLRFNQIRDLFKLKDKNQMVFKYYEMIGKSLVDAKKFIIDMDVKSMPHQSLCAILMSNYECYLPDNYTFFSRNLSVDLKIKEPIIQAILDNFSYKWGELESYETEHLYLSNPVWLRPIIKLDSGKYFCVFPQVFFSFVFPCLDSLIENVDKQALSKRRAEYLEAKVVSIINKRFPEHNIVTNVKWKINRVEYETDIIVFIDSYAVIIEVKSGSISVPALRGAPDRLRRHIEEIIIAPNNQSKRLKQKLEELIANPEIKDELRKKLPVDLACIHRIIRVSVSLEDFATIQANITQWKETGWLPKEFSPCPTLNIADFETLFDFLEHPVQIIHYLGRRQELENTLGYMGDELDLMGLYINTLFNMGDINPGANFIISEMSFPLDAYYNSKDAGINIPKPIPKISHLFSGIFEQLEKRHTPRWTEIGVILNMFSPEDQRRLSSAVDKIKRTVRKNWMIDGHHNTVIIIPPKASEYALCYIAYNDKNANQRDLFIQNAATSGLEPEHVKQCLVIAKNIDQNDHHYHFIGLMDKVSV